MSSLFSTVNMRMELRQMQKAQTRKRVTRVGRRPIFSRHSHRTRYEGISRSPPRNKNRYWSALIIIIIYELGCPTSP